MFVKDLNPGDRFRADDGWGRLRMFEAHSKLPNGDMFVMRVGANMMQLAKADMEVEKK